MPYADISVAGSPFLEDDSYLHAEIQITQKASTQAPMRLQFQVSSLRYLQPLQHACIEPSLSSQIRKEDKLVGPPQSLDGDICLVLEDGSTFTAHAVYLRHASAVLTNALACASPAEQANTRLRVPGVTQRQMQLLLTCLYSFARESWCDTLGPPFLMELARASHLLACTAVLDMADTYLAKKCGIQQDLAQAGDKPWVTLVDAPVQHDLAQRLHLSRYMDLVGGFMGRHAHDVDVSRAEPAIAAVLKGARHLKKQVQADVGADKKKASGV